MLKAFSRVCIGLAAVLFVLALLVFPFVADKKHVSATDTTFQVNVKETLTVSITTPSTWANGDAGDFLRNTVNVSVVSNNSNGFTAGMTTDSSDTYLTNTSKSSVHLPTLTSNATCADATCEAFPSNYWGYSLDDSSNTGTYRPMVNSGAAPVTILASANASSGSRDVYFGAKADSSQASGTYAGTVVVHVVSGTSGADLPGAPSNPALPNPADETASYNPAPTGGTNGTTTYTTRSGNTTTTQVSDGDNASSYYVPPQGVTTKSTTFDINNSSLATGLAVAASVAAASGTVFFIVAKRRENNDDEEEE